MLNRLQMERYARILILVGEYKARINQLRSGGLKARAYDGAPARTYAEGDRIGASLAAVEKLETMLHQLEARRDLLRPEVEETIRILAAGSGKFRIRAELILTMYFLNGRDLTDIASILHTKPESIRTTIDTLFERFEDEETEE